MKNEMSMYFKDITLHLFVRIMIIFLEKKAAIKPFLANIPILYPLKRPENLKVFWCFQGV